MLDEERWQTQTLESPFLEAFEPEEPTTASTWREAITPFEEADPTPEATDANEALVQQAFAALRDEAFDEAVAFLAEETEQSIGARFTGETPATAVERERYGDAQLSPVRFEAEQYLDALEAGVANLDLESLDDRQLETLLDRFDPQPGDLTPAGEEFIGALVRKAKKAVKFVAKAAKGVVGGVIKGVGKVAGAVLGPILGKLKKLINPLLKRVLGFAIGRLPAPLQPAARKLAARFTSEAEELGEEETTSPANLTDLEQLVESFDGAVAQALAGGDVEAELEAAEAGEDPLGGRELERLATARGTLIDRVAGAGDGEELAPAVEEFVPALLGVLKVGVNLIGRPKVVNFLAKFVAQLIGRFVGPQLSKPLSQAIVDTGLRLVMLEAENGEAGVTEAEAGPTAVAGVIEDTVRRLAENEDYVFENEGLMQVAAAEAFSHAVATHFPSRFVRAGVQQAPSLGGAFVVRRPRSPRAFSKYSRVPEVAISSQMADALPGFGGASMGAAMRAAGVRFPMRARMHIYQAAPGTTVERTLGADRGGGRGYRSTADIYPLTPAAAGTLLQEPALGTAVPPRFLRSPKRLAVGQRFFRLEAIGPSQEVPAGQAGRVALRRLRPSRAWCRIHRATGRVSIGFFLSEVDAQSVAEASRQGRGGPTLLKLLSALLTTLGPASSGGSREEGENFEEFAARTVTALAAVLRRRLGGWVLPALAAWTRDNMEVFVRTAAHPDAGVTLQVQLTGVPGLTPGASLRSLRGAGGLRGKPVVAIGVTPGQPGR